LPHVIRVKTGRKYSKSSERFCLKWRERGENRGDYAPRGLEMQRKTKAQKIRTREGAAIILRGKAKDEKKKETERRKDGSCIGNERLNKARGRGKFIPRARDYKCGESFKLNRGGGWHTKRHIKRRVGFATGCWNFFEYYNQGATAAGNRSGRGFGKSPVPNVTAQSAKTEKKKTTQTKKDRTIDT